jgi:mannose-6-phosphate isomerase-like protein (cupin superfamily)
VHRRQNDLVADYKIVNIRDMENAAERFGLAPNVESRFTRSALGSKSSGMSYQRYAPDFKSPFAHTHSKQEEVYVILEGSGRLKVDDEIVELKKWDVILLPPGTVRQWHAGPEGFELLAVGAPVFEESDASLVEDFWQE